MKKEQHEFMYYKGRNRLYLFPILIKILEGASSQESVEFTHYVSTHKLSCLCVSWMVANYFIQIKMLEKKL